MTGISEYCKNDTVTFRSNFPGLTSFLLFRPSETELGEGPSFLGLNNRAFTHRANGMRDSIAMVGICGWLYKNKNIKDQNPQKYFNTEVQPFGSHPITSIPTTWI